jgi:hypothetical protein
MLAPQCPQQPQLVTLQAVDARRAVLGAADMDGRGIEINLLPADVDQLADPQCMPEGHEDQQRSRTGLRLLPAVASRLSISPSVRYSRCR